MRQYYHIGIPTNEVKENEKYFEPIKLYSSGYDSSDYGIEWIRYEDDCNLPEIIKKVPHIAFIVDDLDAEVLGKKILIASYAASKETRIAFIEENGVPIELIQTALDWETLTALKKKACQPK